MLLSLKLNNLGKRRKREKGLKVDRVIKNKIARVQDLKALQVLNLQQEQLKLRLKINK